MRFEVSETIEGGNPDIVLELLEIQLSKICRQVVRSGQNIQTSKIETSLSSFFQNSIAVFSVRTNRTRSLLTASAICQPSVAFWLCLGLTLPTLLGWLIPIVLYLSQKRTVQSTVEDVLRRVKAEYEFDDSPDVPDGPFLDQRY